MFLGPGGSESLWFSIMAVAILVTILYVPVWLGLLGRALFGIREGHSVSRRVRIALGIPLCAWALLGTGYLVDGYRQDAPSRALEVEVAAFDDQITEFSLSDRRKIWMNRRTGCATTSVSSSFPPVLDDADFRARVVRLQDELEAEGWAVSFTLRDFADTYTSIKPWREYVLTARRDETRATIIVTAGFLPGTALPPEFRYDENYLTRVTDGGVEANLSRCS